VEKKRINTDLSPIELRAASPKKPKKRISREGSTLPYFQKKMGAITPARKTGGEEAFGKVHRSKKESY